MMNNSRSMISQRLLFGAQALILALVLSIGIQYAFAAFVGPQESPPTCQTGDPGCDAPVHIGSANQVKPGGLSLNTLNVTANSAFLGNVGIGTVSPFSKLDVQDATVPNAFIRLFSTASNGQAYISLKNSVREFWFGTFNQVGGYPDGAFGILRINGVG